MKILIAGYFGCGNLGDEAILEAMIAGINKYMPGSSVKVLSGDPIKTNHCYKIDAINRLNFRDITKNLKDCDVFILGGGGILQDITSSRSLYYYLFLIWLAKRSKKRIVLLGHSIGPINGRVNRYLVKRILKNIDLLTIRDSASVEAVKKLNLKCGKIALTSDISFTLAAPEEKEINKLLEIEGIKRCKKHLIGVSIREKPGVTDQDWINILALSLDQISMQCDCQIVFLVFHYPDDIAITKRVMQKMRVPAHIIFRQCKPTDMLGIMTKLDGVIGMRLHSVMLSCMAAIPVLGLSYDPKVSSFLSYMKLPFIEADALDGENLIKAFGQMMQKEQQNKDILNIELNVLKQKAEHNFYLLNETVKNKQIKILDTEIDNITMEEAVDRTIGFAASSTPHLITSANPEILMQAEHDLDLRNILNSADLNLPDGVGVLLAGRIKASAFKERVSGIDLMLRTVERAALKGLSVFLLGGKDGVAEGAGRKLKDQYPDLKIAGTHHGYSFNDNSIMSLIKNASPSILFVGLGSPRQEKWSHKYLKELNVPAIVIIGGSFDVISGSLKRAPLWMRNIGLEWLYRLIMQPSRIKRILKLPVFIFRIIRD